MDDGKTMRRVVVTGLGLITPLDCGGGKEVFWTAISSGRCSIGPVSLFDASGYSSGVAAEIKGLTVKPEERWQRLLDTAVDLALADAGIREESKSKTGLILGTVLGGILSGTAAWRARSGLPGSYHLYSGANEIARRIKFEGPVTTISTACASGTDAVGMAARCIQSGGADMMMAGGGDVLSEFAFSGFSALNAMTKGVVRPFSKNRDGLALGEGAGFLVLEEEKHAGARGAHIYCRLSGYSSAADANHMTGPDKNGRGLAAAITGALNESGLKKVDYINAHGTGTPYNDLMETKAFKAVFCAEAPLIPVSSIKSMIGHSFGAAGAIEAITCVLSIQNNMVPPTINLDEPDPECDLDYVPDRSRKAQVNSALTVSAGFGGQNSALLLTRY